MGTAAVLVGLTTESLSLLGFGADAVIDSAASVVLVWRFRTEVRQPHRADRIEEVAERIVGGVLLVLAAYLAAQRGDRHHHRLPSRSERCPERSCSSWASSVLPPLAIAKYRVAQALESPALRADSILTAVAAVLAGIGLVALALSELAQITWADAVGALIVAAIVAREGWQPSICSARADALDAPMRHGVESGTDGAHGRATSSHQEDEMSGTAGTVLRASRLRMELAG